MDYKLVKERFDYLVDVYLTGNFNKNLTKDQIEELLHISYICNNTTINEDNIEFFYKTDISTHCINSIGITEINKGFISRVMNELPSYVDGLNNILRKRKRKLNLNIIINDWL